MSCGHTLTLDLPFPDAVSKVKDAFGAQGFGTRRPSRSRPSWPDGWCGGNGVRLPGSRLVGGVRPALR
jgi:hypothetical protein